VGYRAAVKGEMGNLLMASEYAMKDGRFIPVGGKADLVDGKKLKPGCWYIVENGCWVEVDFTDGVFSYVVSRHFGVTKVRTDTGKVLFIVGDDQGNFAHGESIAEAKKDLVYKRFANFDGKFPIEATGAEWVGIYRAVTGSCSAGVREFVERTGKNLDAIYTQDDLLRIVRGQYGAEKFAAALRAGSEAR
jgi:hypothetical protein